MKKLFISCFLFVASASLVIKPAELSIGEKAPSPDTKMVDISGKSFSFNDYMVSTIFMVSNISTASTISIVSSILRHLR